MIICISEFQLIMNCLQGISVNVDEIVKNQREMRDLLEASGVIKDDIGANDQLFTDKYNICFPMRTKDDLNAFQEMLKTNDICRRDFVSFLLFLISLLFLYIFSIYCLMLIFRRRPYISWSIDN